MTHVFVKLLECGSKDEVKTTLAALKMEIIKYITLQNNI